MLDIKSFTENCRQVIILATEESRRLGHNFVGSEQLLIGLLKADNGATQLLVAAGATLEATTAEVEKIIGRGAGFIAIEPPFTPNAKRAIETAMVTAHEQGFMYVEEEHLLLGIFAQQQTIAQRALENLGVAVEQLKEATLAQVQALPRQKIAPQQVSQAEYQTSLLSPAIPPVSRTAPRSVHVTALPQETGRWVAQVSASNLLDGPSFRSIDYGDTEFEAIASALESLARMYRDYRA